MKRELLELLEGVQDESTIEYLYTFIKLFLEKWGINCFLS